MPTPSHRMWLFGLGYLLLRAELSQYVTSCQLAFLSEPASTCVCRLANFVSLFVYCSKT